MVSSLAKTMSSSSDVNPSFFKSSTRWRSDASSNFQ